MSSYTKKDTLNMFNTLLRKCSQEAAVEVSCKLRDKAQGRYVSTEDKSVFMAASSYLSALSGYVHDKKRNIYTHSLVCKELSDAESEFSKATDGRNLKRVMRIVEDTLISERLKDLKYGFFWSTRRSHYSIPNNKIVYYLAKNYRRSAKFPKSAYAHLAIHETAHAIIRCHSNPLIDVEAYKDKTYNWPTEDDQTHAVSHCREFKRCLLFLLSDFGLIPSRDAVTLGTVKEWGIFEGVSVFDELREKIETYKPIEPYTSEREVLRPLTFEGTWKSPKLDVEYLEDSLFFEDDLRTEEDRREFTRKSIAVALAKSLKVPEYVDTEFADYLGEPNLEDITLDNFEYFATTLQFDPFDPSSQVYIAKMLWELSEADILQKYTRTCEEFSQLIQLQEQLLELCPDGISENSHALLKDANLFSERDQAEIFDIFIFYKHELWSFMRELDMVDVEVRGGDARQIEVMASKGLQSKHLEGYSRGDFFDVYRRIYNSMMNTYVHPMSISTAQYAKIRRLCDTYLASFGLRLSTSVKYLYPLKHILSVKSRCANLSIVDLPKVLVLQEAFDLRESGWYFKEFEGYVLYDGATFNGQVVPLEYVDERALNIPVDTYRPQDFSYFRNRRNRSLLEEFDAQQSEIVNIKNRRHSERDIPILGTDLVIGDVLGDTRPEIDIHGEDARNFSRLFADSKYTTLGLSLEGILHGNLLPLIYQNVQMSTDTQSLSGNGWILEKDELANLTLSEDASLDLSLHLSSENDIQLENVVVEDYAFLYAESENVVFFRHDSINLSRYTCKYAFFKRVIRDYISAGIPMLTLFSNLETSDLFCVFSDGYDVYLLDQSKTPFIEGASIHFWLIYDAITSKSVTPVASIREVRQNFELAASSKATLEIEDYLDCEVLTYGSQMHLNLLDIPKMYGDSTVYEVLNNLEAQSKIKLRNITYRGADQLFAIVKPSTELGFVYANSAGEYVEVSYSEAWFRIYLSES